MNQYALVPFQSESFPYEINTQLYHNDMEVMASFRIRGDLSSIDFSSPSSKKHARALNLWERTVFEIFVQDKNNHYLEFNFSPQFEWNAFYFEIYRGPLFELEIATCPSIDILDENGHFLIMIKIPLAFFTTLDYQDVNELKIGCSSIIKSTTSEKKYWALRHCDERPNFHHFDSFIGKF